MKYRIRAAIKQQLPQKPESWLTITTSGIAVLLIIFFLVFFFAPALEAAMEG